MSEPATTAFDLPEADLDDSDRAVLQHVTEFGWHVVLIPEDNEGPGFAFTVGLFHTFGHPELIVVGLGPIEPECLSQIVLNDLGVRIDEGERFADGDQVSGTLEGYDVRFEAVAEANYPEFVGTARWFYRQNLFPLLQVLWPDKRKRFPGDPKCPKGMLKLQPRLKEPQTP